MPSKTYTQRKEDTQRSWKIVDATGQSLGRMASQIAACLRGKDKPTFTPHVDGGDFVVVVNAEKVELKGAKLDEKMYHYHTGYRGGIVTRSARQLRQDDPEKMIRLAVWGMLPKGALGRQMINKLKVYRGAEHPHAAQQPKTMAMNL
jgi:large subunit ribosomal protein L13